VQALQWFLTESTWNAQAVTRRRVEVLRADPATAPDGAGVLVIDETGDRKWGTKTSHVGRQYLGSIGKVDRGVVTVGSLRADERVFYPLTVGRFTPKQHFALGERDPRFRTKPQIAVELVTQADGSRRLIGTRFIPCSSINPWPRRSRSTPTPHSRNA
jgi:SRSO17 transposase